MKATASFLRGVVARRILGLFMLCAMIPIGSLALLSLWEMSGKLRDQTDQRLRHANKNIAMSIFEGLSFLKTEMEARSLADAAGSRKSLAGVAESSHGGTRQRFLGMTAYRGRAGGDTLFGVPCPLPPLTEESRKHLAAGQSILLLQGIDGAPPRIFLAIAIESGTPERGVLVGEIHPNYLRYIVENAMPVEGDVFVLDSTGLLLYHSAPFPAEISSRIVDPSPRLFSGQFEWDREGETILVNYRSIFLEATYLARNWVVVITRSKAEVFAHLRSFTRSFVLILVLALSLALLLSVIQIRKSLVPLGKLREGTKKITEGDFESRIAIDSGDEFEDLARSFNSMSDRLKKEFRALTETSHIVRSVLTGLEKESIVRTVLSDFPKVMPSEKVALSLLDPHGNGTGRTYLNGSGADPTEESDGLPSLFTPDEMKRLAQAEIDLIVRAVEDFPGFLPRLSGNGTETFFLYPIFRSHKLAGVIAAGFGNGSEPVKEDRIRARQVADQVSVAMANAGLLEELSSLNRGAMVALARAVDANSPWTAGHSERVTEISIRIGREMGLEQAELDRLLRAGMLHDIGKIGIPRSILDKPGPLTTEERSLINRHPGKGVNILSPILAFQDAIPIVLQHHEKFDGSGYPNGLSGEGIVLGARILAVADVYDALVSDRPYRPGWQRERVLAFIETNRGLHFDPAVAETFLRFIREETPDWPNREARTVQNVEGRVDEYR